MAEPARVQRQQAPPPPGTWVHGDTRLGEHVAEGYRRALQCDWQSGGQADRVAAFRALLVERCHVMALLAGTVEASADEFVALRIDPTIRASVTPERAWAAEVLYATPRVLEREALRGSQLQTETHADVGALPAAAVVGIAIAGAAAVAFVADRAATVIDRELSRRTEMQKLMQVDATALKVVREHTEREKQAGQELPLDEPTRQVLGMLSKAHAEISARVERPMSSPLPNLAGAKPSSWLSGGIGLGLGAAAVIVALAFTRR